ncbi:SRPBCC family protein [Marinobacterium jannaschii]|uniref:SRPBCC family protein n=1 Tax=Marinobacterium jannaschii TaxID=64970 RepID=UPI0004897D10|nr:SRPBCC family protein [Marinobacterium jannaschii]
MGQCYNSVVVNADADRVWQLLREFHDLSWAPSVVTHVEQKGNIVGANKGAKRILNDAFHETLLTLDDEERSLSYSIDDGPGPVAADRVHSYIGGLRVYAVTATGQAFVEWYSRYETSDDSAVAEFCNPIYQALLSDLNRHFDG